MKLSFNNFFSHLIFHPFDANTKKHQRMALAASIACGVFSLGICHGVCALVRYVIKPKKPDGRDAEVSKTAGKVLNPQASQGVSGVKNSTAQGKTTTEEGTVDPTKKTEEAEKIVPPATEPQKMGEHRGFKVGPVTIEVFLGDLFAQKVDALVNPANETLNGGGGVDGLFEMKAGRAPYEECQTQLKNQDRARCNTGEAFLTGAGKLGEREKKEKEEEIKKEEEKHLFKHIIHTPGPTGNNLNRKQLLRDSYYNSLLRAQEAGLKSIAFPAISIGIFTYPTDEAAEVALAAVQEFCKDHPDTTLQHILLVYWNDSPGIKSYNHALKVCPKPAQGQASDPLIGIPLVIPVV